MALNDITIPEIVKEYREENEKFSYYLYGVVTRGMVNTFYILNFSDKKIDLLEVVGFGRVTSHSYISVESIESIKFSNWFLGMGRKIKISSKEGQKIVVKVNKMTLGMKKQNEHLFKIEDEYRKLGLVV